MGDEKFILTGPPDLEFPHTLSFSQLLIDCLKNGGDLPAVIDGATGNSVSFKQILQKSVNLAKSLKIRGLGKGDVVSISSENRFEFIFVACAVFYLGGIIAPMSVNYKLDEIKHALNLVKPKFIFCSPLTYQDIKQIVGNNIYVKIVLFGKEKISDETLLDSLISLDSRVGRFQPTRVDPLNDSAVILYSSGTTGLPKGVVLTHKNLLTYYSHRNRGMAGARLTKEDNVIFALSPWSHSYGFIMLMVQLCTNHTLVFANKFEPKLYLEILEKYKITIAVTVPSLVVFLAKDPLVSKYNLSSLERIWSGAAPLSKEIEDEVKKRLNLKQCTQAYGMTETTLGVLGLKSKKDGGMKYGTVGKVSFGTKAKVIDIETGEALGPNKNGELCFKGPLMMKGYIGDSSSTQNVFDKDGWLHTGDIGYYDTDEYFYIVDRIKELIKYKGHQVAPAELENVLVQHEGVSDAGVLGLPDDVAGELPIAFVVRQPNSSVTKEELTNFVASKVSNPKKLRGGIVFVQEIPRNHAGKILRRELKEQLKNVNKSKL